MTPPSSERWEIREKYAKKYKAHDSTREGGKEMMKCFNSIKEKFLRGFTSAKTSTDTFFFLHPFETGVAQSV
jgi:hypothetical protein